MANSPTPTLAPETACRIPGWPAEVESWRRLFSQLDEASADLAALRADIDRVASK